MNSRNIAEQKKNIVLTKRQRQIIIGKVLGDGCLVANTKGSTVRLQIEHSITQKTYVDWLYKEIGHLARTSPKIKIQQISGKQYEKYWFNTLSIAQLRFYYHQFYQCGEKRIPKLIHRWLTPLTLAVWFMDDGSVKSKYHKAKIINTQSFSKEDIQRVIKVLDEKYGVKAKLRSQRSGYQIYLLSETIARFEQLIEPYIIPSMKYKLG